MKILRDAGDQEVLPNDNFMASTDNYPLGPTKPRGGSYPASYPNQTILHRFSEFEQEFVKLRHCHLIIDGEETASHHTEMAQTIPEHKANVASCTLKSERTSLAALHRPILLGLSP